MKFCLPVNHGDETIGAWEAVASQAPVLFGSAQCPVNRKAQFHFRSASLSLPDNLVKFCKTWQLCAFITKFSLGKTVSWFLSLVNMRC